MIQPTIDDYKTLYRGDYMRARWLDRADGIAAMLRPEWRILEAGAGRGDLAQHMRGLGYRWTACDPCPSGTEVAPAELPRLSAVFCPNQFDCSVSIDVLEHLPQDGIPAALRDLRTVAPRGVWSVANMSDVHLVNGEPMELHLTQQPPAWWIAHIKETGGNAVAHIINCDRFWLEVTW